MFSSILSRNREETSFQSWYNKKTGDQLTPAEQKMQKSIGIAEMIFGSIAAVVSAEADNGRKARPLFFFANLLGPSLIDLNKTTTIPFMSPY